MTGLNFLKNSKGVLFCSPSGKSEYSELSKRFIQNITKQHFPVTWYRFQSDSTDDDNDYLFNQIKDTINKNLDFDTAIFQCDPNVWHEHIEKFKIKFIGKKLIGYPIWNSFCDIQNNIIDYLNEMDEIWVLSDLNKQFFEKSKVTVPIKVVPIPSLELPLPDVNFDTLVTLLLNSKVYTKNSYNIFEYGERWKIFYTMGEWNEKTNLETTIRAFCESFTFKDPVKLIIKTHHINFLNENIKYCISKVENILSKYSNHPEVILITENISRQEELFLHSIGDYFFTTTEEVNFCLNAYDAYQYGKKVIIPGYEGHKKYLEKNSQYIDPIKTNNNENDFIKNCIFTLKECFNNQQINLKKSPIVLSKGWFFKEKKGTLFYRKASSNVEISLKDQSFNYLKLNLTHDIKNFTKTFNVIIDDSIKKSYSLNKDSYDSIIIPVKGVKNIKIYIDQSNNSKEVLLNKNSEFSLESVDLIKENILTNLSVCDIDVENELTSCLELKNNIKDIEIDFLHKNKYDIIKIEMMPDKNIKGIIYVGQYGTSGYATAAKGNLCHFFAKGIPITWIPLYFDNSILTDDCMYNILAKSLIDKPIENSNLVILHCTPDLWLDYKTKNRKLFQNKKLIGYTVWETSKLPLEWVEYINNSVEEVWCPSKYNKQVFIDSGVYIPITVFPHVFLKKELPERNSINIKINNNIIKKSEELYTFYNISELNPRKGVEDLLNVYCRAFNKNDKVRLIIKVHYKNYSESNKKICIQKLSEIINSYKNPPKIFILTENLTDKEILALHSIGDCYVSLCKSEGFGLTIFEAYKYDKKVIATGYGGHLDFLGCNYTGLVKYKLDKITGMDDFKYYSDKEQEWAYPNLEHAIELMKNCL